MFATRRALKLIAVVLVVGFLLTLCVWFGLKIQLTFGAVPLLKTPAWEYRYPDEAVGQLMLRREAETAGALLLKRTDLENVYRYDPITRRLSEVSAAQWQNAGGAIAKCGEQSVAGVISGPRRDDRAHKLFLGERELPTAGRFALNNVTSPSGRWVAVVSADGPAVPSILPFMGDLIYGQRYHEVISLLNAVHVDPPIPIPVTDRNDFLEPCWSADEQFVVYTTYFFNLLIVINSGVAY
jgi:hypothetical protein